MADAARHLGAFRQPGGDKDDPPLGGLRGKAWHGHFRHQDCTPAFLNDEHTGPQFPGRLRGRGKTAALASGAPRGRASERAPFAARGGARERLRPMG